MNASNGNGKVVELVERLAKASEQIDALRQDILRQGLIPNDADIAILIASHHLSRSMELVKNGGKP